jgi:hypothetical protein
MLTRLIWLFLSLLIPATSSAQSGDAAPAAVPRETSDAFTKDISKEAVVVERYVTHAVYQADGSGTREVAAVIRVQSEAGVQSLAVLRFAYNTVNDAADIDYVRVRKPDGKIIATPDANIQDMPADVTRVAPVYSSIHEKHVTVKALGVGDVLEYQVRFRTAKPQIAGQFWYEHTFLQGNVVQDEELEISVPKDKYVKVSRPQLAPQVKEDGARRIYKWKSVNLQREDSAEQAPKREGHHPSVQVTTFGSWEEVGRWYGDLQRPQLKVTPEIRAKASEITKGLTGDENKMHALYDFVSTQVHYVSLSFGVGSYQPHAADEVLGNQYGDCKDKHTLLAALMKAAGYDAWPALINSSRKIDADLPSPGQFDHVITLARLGPEAIWLDTTAEVAPFGLLISVLRDKQVLVIPAEEPALLMKTPEAPRFAASSTFTADGKLTGDGTLAAHMERSSRGDEEVMLRAAFRRVPPAQW